MNEIKEGQDYRFITESSESGMVDIELTSGNFEGIIYRYGKVKVEEDKENAQAYLNFIFEIIDPKGFDELESNLEFKNHIGEILTSIMMKNMSLFDNESSIEVFYED